AVWLGAVVGDQPLCEGEFVGFGHGRDCRLRAIVSTPSMWQEQHPGRAFPALDSEHRADVCVVGAGVTGASCAWRLLEHGVGVTVVDGRGAAASAPGRNGGRRGPGTGP